MIPLPIRATLSSLLDDQVWDAWDSLEGIPSIYEPLLQLDRLIGVTDWHGRGSWDRLKGQLKLDLKSTPDDDPT